MGHPFHSTPREEAACLTCQREAEDARQADLDDEIDDAERGLIDACMTWYGLGDRPFSREVMKRCCAILEKVRAKK